MNIMRETLLLENRDDLIEKMDLLDITAIDSFIAMGIPYAEETRELLMLQFNEKFCDEINEVAKRRPEFMQYGQNIVKGLSTEDKFYDEHLIREIINVMKAMVEEGDLEAARCMHVCFTYYTSFFLDE